MGKDLMDEVRVDVVGTADIGEEKDVEKEVMVMLVMITAAILPTPPADLRALMTQITPGHILTRELAGERPWHIMQEQG
jgi:hypothetical protein